MTIHPKPLSAAVPESAQSQNRFSYALVWKQRKLIVQCVNQSEAMPLPSLVKVQGLVACLQRSPVRLVKLDPALGEEALQLWANACRQAEKPVFLRLPPLQQSPQKQQPIRWRLKQLLEQCIAALLLLLFSPLLLVIMLLVWRSMPGSLLVQECRVGERGKFFKMLKFRTKVGQDSLARQRSNQPVPSFYPKEARAHALGCFLERYSLDELPQLVNVLRGEMSLVGLRPLPLNEAMRVQRQQRLNIRPGMTGIWQIGGRPPREAFDELVNSNDLKYAQRLSLRQDLTFLLLTIPRVIAGVSVH